jgi:hypothetical protein
MDKKSPSPRLDRKRSPKHHHSKANSLSGINLPVRDTNTVEPKKPEPEPELDIDIARAYCELTEGTTLQPCKTLNIFILMPISL